MSSLRRQTAEAILCGGVLILTLVSAALLWSGHHRMLLVVILGVLTLFFWFRVRAEVLKGAQATGLLAAMFGGLAAWDASAEHADWWGLAAYALFGAVLCLSAFWLSRRTLRAEA